MDSKDLLLKKALTATVLLAGKRIVLQLIFTLTNVVLARLLFPADFGMFAIVTFVATIFSVFSDLGFGAALIQKKKELVENDKKTVFSTQIILNLTIILLIFLLSPKIAQYYSLGDRVFCCFVCIVWSFLLRHLGPLVTLFWKGL